MPAEEIPKFGKGGVVVNEGPDFHVEIQDVPVPEPGPNDLLIRLNATGLCMSDVHFMTADWGLGPMSQFNTKCAGHEGAGVVVKVGSEVKDWNVGDRAGVKPILDTCHACEECFNGRENYCTKAIYTGFMAPGTYQQYLTSPARYTTRIPDGVSDYVAGPIMCSASTMHRALIESPLKPTNWVVIPGGGGGVGIQGVQLANAMGMRVVVVDHGSKEELVKKMGAEVFIDFTKSSDVPGDVVKACDGVGAHGVLVTAYQAYPDALKYLGSRAGGTVMAIALPPVGKINLGAEPAAFVFRNQGIRGSLVGTMQDTVATLEYAKRGLLKQICEVRPLSKMAESVEELKAGKVVGRIVIDFNQP